MLAKAPAEVLTDLWTPSNSILSMVLRMSQSFSPVLNSGKDSPVNLQFDMPRPSSQLSRDFIFSRLRSGGISGFGARIVLDSRDVPM